MACIVRAQTGADSPEGGGVIVFFEVGHFVGCDIIEDCRRSHDQAPREHQVASGRARSPARTRIPQADPAVGPAQGGTVAIASRGQPVSGERLEKGLCPRADPGRIVRQDQRDSGAFWPASFAGDQGDGFTFDGQTGTEHCVHAVLDCLEVFADPDGPVFGEVDGFLFGKPSRQGQRHLPVEPRYPKRQSPCPGRAAQFDLDRGVA